MNIFEINHKAMRKEKYKQELISGIKKCQRKANINMANATGIFEKTKALRPLMLRVIRSYDNIKHDPEWTDFIQVAYRKSCLWDEEIDRLCLSIELKVKEENYIKSFKKNLKKIKKMCRDTSVSYYSLLPDNIPIDVRSHCVQFISQATFPNQKLNVKY